VAEYILLDAEGKALLSIGRGNVGGLLPHFLAGISHRDAEAAFAKHENVVRHVTQSGDLVFRNAIPLGEEIDDGSLRGFGMRDIEIVGLGTRGGNMALQSLPQLATAARSSLTPTIFTA